MRALFGVMSLLVVLAAVGLLAARQLKVGVPVAGMGAESDAAGAARGSTGTPTFN